MNSETKVRQCDFCRVPYQSHGNKLCAECLLELDQDFIKIREYLYDHEGAGIDEVSEATDVTRKTILHLLKEERLLVGDENGNANSLLTCESCKRPIHTGRMCVACKNEVMAAIQESIGPVTPVRRPKRYDEDNEIENFKGVAKLQLKGGKRL